MQQFKKWLKREKLHQIVVYTVGNKLKRLFNASFAQKYTAKTVVGERESSLSKNMKILDYVVNNAIKNTSNISTTNISTRKKLYI